MVGYWYVSSILYVHDCGGGTLCKLQEEVNRAIKNGWDVDGPLMWKDEDVVQRMAMWLWHD